jgi:hypothetical protein
MMTEFHIESAREICRQIAKSIEFKSFVMGTKFTYTKKSNNEILDNVFMCNFKLCKIQFYHQPKRLFRSLIVGTYSNGLIRVNTAAVTTVEELVGSIGHEYMHFLGYKHPYFKTSTRKLSVPYALGCYFKQESRKYL